MLSRFRLAVTIVERMRKAVGNDFIIIFRLSMLDLIEQGTVRMLCWMIASAPYDCSHIWSLTTVQDIVKQSKMNKSATICNFKSPRTLSLSHSYTHTRALSRSLSIRREHVGRDRDARQGHRSSWCHHHQYRDWVARSTCTYDCHQGAESRVHLGDTEDGQYSTISANPLPHTHIHTH